MRYGLVLQDGCFGSAVTMVTDILRVAQSISAEEGGSNISFELLGRQQLTTNEGMVITTDARLDAVADYDLVVVPAMAAFTDAEVDERLGAPGGQAAVRALRCLDPERTTVAAACSSVFAVADAGLLSGRQATTSWFLSSAFKRRFPDVRLDLDAMVVTDGPIVSAGAAFAHADLTLGLLRRQSPELAHRVAQTLLLDERRSQAAYISYDLLDHDDDLVRAFERHVREHLDRPLDVSEICAEIGTSRRTLERRMQATLATSPLAMIQRLRVERARHLRRTTNLGFDAIARQVGYANAESLRALLRRR